MFSGPKKPYTAVTVQIDRLTSEEYEVDDSSGIVDLIEVVRLQGSGPSEASRALRKKLKYGTIHRQLRALTILDFLIQNAGERFLRDFADEPLLERLRVAATDPMSDQLVRDKCRQIFPQWASSYSGTPGMERVAGLYKQLPKRKKPARQQQSKVVKETEEPREGPIGHSVSVSAGHGPSTILSSPSTAKKSSVTLSSGPQPTTGHKKSKKNRSKAFNLEKERPEILQTLASASVATTNLMNAMKLVDRENERVSENQDVMARFELCKNLRRQVLRYIQYVESDDFLGSLIHANEELVNALMAFEVMDKSVDNDSDSDSQIGSDQARSRSGSRDLSEDISGLRLDGPSKPPRPPRPANLSFSHDDLESESDDSENEDDDDEDNPFGDRNAVPTPRLEKPEPTWREV